MLKLKNIYFVLIVSDPNAIHEDEEYEVHDVDEEEIIQLQGNEIHEINNMETDSRSSGKGYHM